MWKTKLKAKKIVARSDYNYNDENESFSVSSAAAKVAFEADLFQAHFI